MGLIQNLLKGMGKGKREFKEKFKQAQDEYKINKMVEQRTKSSNERELEEYIEKQRQNNIKLQLDKIHKKQNEEWWKSKNSLLDKGTSILKEDRPILKEKNIFTDDKTEIPFTSGGENMFFKW